MKIFSVCDVWAVGAPIGNNSQFEDDYFTEMCSGSEAGCYLRSVDFVYHSTLGWRERIFIELMTSDRKLKASREGSK